MYTGEDKKHRHFPFLKIWITKYILKNMLANFENSFRYITKQQHFYTMENNIVLSLEIFYIQKTVYSYKKNGSDTYLHGYK